MEAAAAKGRFGLSLAAVDAALPAVSVFSKLAYLQAQLSACKLCHVSAQCADDLYASLLTLCLPTCH